MIYRVEFEDASRHSVQGRETFFIEAKNKDEFHKNIKESVFKRSKVLSITEDGEW